jgi:hypothetical protein
MKLQKQIPLTLLATLGICLLTSNALAAKEDGFIIAENPSIPGKNNTDGRGEDFAPELYKQFCEAGGESYLLTFRWRREFESSKNERKGSMVVFRDQAGQYWGIDLYSEKPVALPARESKAYPQKWLGRMYPTLVFADVEVKTNPELEGRFAVLQKQEKTSPSTAAINSPAPSLGSR